MLSQADNITGEKLHFCPKHVAILRDHGVLTWAECGRASRAVAVETAVSRKDVSGREVDVRLWPIFSITSLTKNNVWPSKQVDYEVLSADKRDKLPHNEQELTGYSPMFWLVL